MIDLDLDEFYALDTFGVVATITTSTITLTVNGVLDDAYLETFGAEGSDPVFECRKSDVVLAGKGDAITINGINYTIASMKPDSYGATFITLEVV